MRIQFKNTHQEHYILPKLPAAYSQSFKCVQIGQAFVTILYNEIHTVKLVFPCFNLIVAISSLNGKSLPLYYSNDNVPFLPFTTGTLT